MTTQTKKILMPGWLKKKLPDSVSVKKTGDYLKSKSIETVCTNSRCPNIGECYELGNVSFLILGNKCTRSCPFCAIVNSSPDKIDPQEAKNISDAVKTLGLSYVVITSVTRDDLADGGANHYANVVKSIKEEKPLVKVETLVPDFKGNKKDIDIVANSGIDVFSHNMETVRRLYNSLRPGFDYEIALEILRYVSKKGTLYSKSGFMMGLGETLDEVEELMLNIRDTGCKLLTVGQYLKPFGSKLEVVNYVNPEVFAELEIKAKKMGFANVKCAPFARSSYMAENLLRIKI